MARIIYLLTQDFDPLFLRRHSPLLSEVHRWGTVLPFHRGKWRGTVPCLGSRSRLAVGTEMTFEPRSPDAPAPYRPLGPSCW